MIILVLVSILTFPSMIQSRVLPPESLDVIRTNMMITEDRMMEGGHQSLSEKELLVDDIIRTLKHHEINEGYHNLTCYAPALHFFRAKPLIDQSQIFDIIKAAPKGSVLHVHNTASVSASWIVRNLTYRKEAEYCTDTNGLTIFTAGFHENCINKPTNIVEARKKLKSDQVGEFDSWLMSKLTMVKADPEHAHFDANRVWHEFDVLFDVIKGLITYLPFYKDFHYNMMEEFYEDGIFYTEIRTSFNELYDSYGHRYDYIKSAGVIYDVVREFGATHPNFIGTKAIFAVFRRSNSTTLEHRIKMYVKLKMTYPSFVIGFDFVGQEDLGVPLVALQHALGALPQGTNFFFHAGETNWWGSPVDFNIIDAILLNTTRIGHGYALLKHPLMWDAVRTKGIAIEVSVISNQVLHLVHDLRNHPAAIYLALNLPVVITNDDPSFWGATGLSYDWYYAFMSLAPATAGLKLLKQLAMNSIEYSILTGEERQKFGYVFSGEWEAFLDKIIQKYGSVSQTSNGF